MSPNPEQRVIDAIDALVNEQLAGGPVDDYSVNRYPRCDRCPCQWHGERCGCGCVTSTGERKHEPKPNLIRQNAYTIADLQRFQDQRIIWQHGSMCSHRTIRYVEGEPPRCDDCGEQIPGDPLIVDLTRAEQVAQVAPLFESPIYLGQRDMRVRFWGVVGGQQEQIVEATLEYVGDLIGEICGIPAPEGGNASLRALIRGRAAPPEGFVSSCENMTFDDDDDDEPW